LNTGIKRRILFLEGCITEQKREYCSWRALKRKKTDNPVPGVLKERKKDGSIVPREL
jgi:hypothetical protein